MTPEPLRPQLPSHWEDFLRAVDALLPSQATLHCLGGFVVEAVYGVPRRTGDIDYVAVHPVEMAEVLESTAGEGSDLARRHGAYLQQVTISDVPDDYEQRLLRLDTELNNMVLLVMDPYDLILSKLARNSAKDREDVQELAGRLRLKFATVKERYEREMRPWIANPAKHDLTLEIWKDFFRS